MTRLAALVIAVLIAIGASACTQPASSGPPVQSPAMSANPTPAAIHPSPIEPGYGTPSPGT